MTLSTIRDQARQAVTELLEKSSLPQGSLLVVGCSTSEISGGTIGHNGSLETARAVYDGIAPVLHEHGIHLAAQCCEHLNRALIVERSVALARQYEEVCVVPQPHAGGSWATVCWQQFADPVAVEMIRAEAGMDIGDTLIGMHLRAVAVPVRLSIPEIGCARVVCARTRPKYIGGSRAVYER